MNYKINIFNIKTFEIKVRYTLIVAIPSSFAAFRLAPMSSRKTASGGSTFNLFNVISNISGFGLRIFSTQDSTTLNKI